MRTEPDLLRQMADTLCHHPWYALSDALHEVMADEPSDRWLNLIASMAQWLDLPPINAYDHDDHLDDRAAYATRLDTWAADVDNALLVSEQLRLLADRAEAALTDTSRSRIGGRACITGATA